MNKKYKIVHLIGLTRGNEDKFRDAEKILTRKGFIVFAPVFYKMDEYLSFGKTPNMLDDMCYEKLLMCDFCVLVTPEHIGKSTRERIKQAHSMGKEICILNGIALNEFDLPI